MTPLESASLCVFWMEAKLSSNLHLVGKIISCQREAASARLREAHYRAEQKEVLREIQDLKAGLDPILRQDGRKPGHRKPRQAIPCKPGTWKGAL